VAVNCWVKPAATEVAAGVTEIDASRGGATVKVAEPLMMPEVALMVAVPCATPVAKPLPLTVAVWVAEDVQAAEVVRFCVVPLL
jgi:hypothetical protein